MRDGVTVERLDAIAAPDDIVEIGLQMDEEAFRAFYDRTSRSLWLYLSRLTRNPHAADDLLQETFYRFLRADRPYASEAHRRNYLFRIATNLVRDGYRRRTDTTELIEDEQGSAASGRGDEEARAASRTDLDRAFARLKPRDRALVWLAYAHGSSHHEIAETLGLKTGSVKAMLFRARRRLASLLQGEL
jgi:RNA polymerase sigma-70 factor (ECF subfamily)